jgi:hypothetical protein
MVRHQLITFSRRLSFCSKKCKNEYQNQRRQSEGVGHGRKLIRLAPSRLSSGAAGGLVAADSVIPVGRAL